MTFIVYLYLRGKTTTNIIQTTKKWISNLTGKWISQENYHEQKEFYNLMRKYYDRAKETERAPKEKVEISAILQEIYNDFNGWDNSCDR